MSWAGRSSFAMASAAATPYDMSGSLVFRSRVRPHANTNRVKLHNFRDITRCAKTFFAHRFLKLLITDVGDVRAARLNRAYAVCINIDTSRMKSGFTHS